MRGISYSSSRRDGAFLAIIHKKRLGRHSRAFLVFGLAFGISLFSNPGLRAEEYKESAIPTTLSETPRLWHIRLTGADLARERFTAAQNSRPVPVVVYDEPIGDIAQANIELPEWKARHRYLPKWSIPSLSKFLGLDSEEEPKIADTSSISIHSADIVDSFSLSPDQSIGIDFISLIRMISLTPEQMVDKDPSEYVEIEEPLEFIKPENIGHGRHVAGTIGALDKDFGVFHHIEPVGLGIFQAPIYRQGEEIISAFNALAQYDKKDFVINMSVALSSAPSIARELDQIIAEKNANVVIAAGNSYAQIEEGDFLSDLKGATVVSALSHYGAPVGFSNHGERVDIIAPGVDITSLSKDSEDDRVMSGTSMASPLVAGAVAELRALLPNARHQDLQQILYKTSWDILRLGKDEFSGNGLINIYKASYVANRIAANGIKSSDEIQVAVRQSNYFNTEMERRRAVLNKNQFDELSEEYSKALYAEVLISDRLSDFMKLDNYYQERFPTYAMGIENLALNSEMNIPDRESCEFEEWTQKLSYMQILAWLRDPRDWGLLESLQSSDALLEVYRILLQRDFDSEVYGVYSAPFSHILEQMATVGNLQQETRKLFEKYAPERLEDFEEITNLFQPAPPVDEMEVLKTETPPEQI